MSAEDSTQVHNHSQEAGYPRTGAWGHSPETRSDPSTSVSASAFLSLLASREQRPDYNIRSRACGALNPNYMVNNSLYMDLNAIILREFPRVSVSEVCELSVPQKPLPPGHLQSPPPAN